MMPHCQCCYQCGPGDSGAEHESDVDSRSFRRTVVGDPSGYQGMTRMRVSGVRVGAAGQIQRLRQRPWSISRRRGLSPPAASPTVWVSVDVAKAIILGAYPTNSTSYDALNETVKPLAYR